MPETKAFHSPIHEISVLAFDRETEARLVENLRKSPDFVREISFVAIKKGRVVGHMPFNLHKNSDKEPKSFRINP